MKQILVYGDSLTWGIIPDSRKCEGMAAGYAAVAERERCAFFDAASVTTTSKVDGVHLDADQHALLGRALASPVSVLLAS
ncbi:MAG: hypothetical protein ABR587_00055 [Candidatus Binatia bacterium]